MSNISAGIGRGQMEVLDRHVSLRRNMHEFYYAILGTIPGIHFLKEPNSNYFSNHWLTAITIDPLLTGGKTSEMFRLLLEKDNIESRPLWKPMHLQPVFAHHPYYGERVAETLFDQGLCLPSGSNLTDADRQRIENVLVDFFN
jgi:dTDP-4-amino-4,6-dideoxygalactose transaminase